MVKNVDNIVFLNSHFNIRAGGPSGYIANLKKAISEYSNDKRIVFISRDDIPQHNKYKLQNAIAKIFTLFIPIKKYRKTLRKKIITFLLKRPISIDYLEIDSIEYEDYIKVLDNYNFKTIICHCTRDAIFIRNYLNYKRSSAQLLLMSHSPQPPSQEVYHYEKLSNNTNADKNFKIWQAIEKKAFDSADIVIFPTKEAMEPYTKVSDYFKELARTKDIRFIPTGCNSINIEDISEDIRKKYNITTKYIISFIGRHTHIKGYDILKEIAQSILETRNDITFVIAGDQTKEFLPLHHSQWVELGRINPANLLKISDLFILPNRETYFDLILLEVLSSGVPIIASNTGGNKSVYETTHALELYDDKQECINKINSFLALSDNDKAKKRAETRAAYNNNYTLKHFAQNYLKLINQIIKEKDK